MKLVKSDHIHCVPCQNGDFVLYNTILNSPIVINKECLDFFTGLAVVDTDDEKHSEDESAFIELLCESNLLFEEGRDEAGICSQSHADYLAKMARGETIKFLDLRISENCNFGCRHCMSSRARNNALMTTDLAIKIVDHVVPFMVERQDGFSQLDMHYGNAEPLLNFGLIRAVQAHLNARYPNIEKSISINTNLSLLTEEMADFFIREGIVLYISLDGNRESNDAIRINGNGGGTYDLIMSKVEMLVKRGYPLKGVSVTLTDGNYPYFESSFVDWCKEQGFISLAIDFDLVNPLETSTEERAEFLAKTWEKCQLIGLEFFGTWITPFLNLSNRSIAETHYSFCKGIHGQSLSVSPSGMVYICGSSATPLCHYSQFQSSIQKGGAIHDLVKSRLVGANEMCKGCCIEGACAGQCHVTREYSATKTREQCKLYKAITLKLLDIQCSKEAL